MTHDPVTHGPRQPRSTAPAPAVGPRQPQHQAQHRAQLSPAPLPPPAPATQPSSPAAPLPPSPPPQPPRPWWHDAVVYQIYPRSFADSNGDGTGDLRGVTSRVPYLAALGVDAVWLSPFYPSALADGGYDVDDYRDVAPELGTLADFDEMTRALHEAGIRVMVDLVPNHTSDRHAWFRAALEAGPGSAERERYHFRPGTGPDGCLPPNDWRSMFGGPAWQRVEDRAPDGTPLTGPGTGRPWQWYLHMFTPQQPDLSWDHPEVRADFLDVLRFWADRGVDGFRVDVAPGLVKDLSEPYRPAAEIPWWPLPDDGSHPLFDRDAVHEIYRDWRRLLDSYDPPRLAVAEAGVVASRRPAYAHSLGQAFNFQLQDADFTPVSFRWAVEAGLADLEASGSTTWVLGCHDTPRLATRLGFDLADDVPPEHEDPTYLGGVSQRMSRVWIQHEGTSPANDAALGLRRARAAALLEMALPGAMYLYQGDELGLPEVPDIPEDRLQDPIAFRMRGVEKGRDGCRVPLPWTVDGPTYGFGPDRPGSGGSVPGVSGPETAPGGATTTSDAPGPGGGGAPRGAWEASRTGSPGSDGGGEPHLPQPEGWGRMSVEAQEADASSTLALYRQGLALRRRYWAPLRLAAGEPSAAAGPGAAAAGLCRPEATRAASTTPGVAAASGAAVTPESRGTAGPLAAPSVPAGSAGSSVLVASSASTAGGPTELVWLETPEHVLAFERGGVQCWTAFGAPVELPAGEVLLSSEPVLPAGGLVEPAGGPEAGRVKEPADEHEPVKGPGRRPGKEPVTLEEPLPAPGGGRVPPPGERAASASRREVAAGTWVGGRGPLVLPADATAWLVPATG